MKIRRARDEFHPDGWTDRQTDKKKLIVEFPNFPKRPFKSQLINLFNWFSNFKFDIVNSFIYFAAPWTPRGRGLSHYSPPPSPSPTATQLFTLRVAFWLPLPFGWLALRPPANVGYYAVFPDCSPTAAKRVCRHAGAACATRCHYVTPCYVKRVNRRICNRRER
jgi:hypothetical protein